MAPSGGVGGRTAGEAKVMAKGLTGVVVIGSHRLEHFVFLFLEVNVIALLVGS